MKLKLKRKRKCQSCEQITRARGRKACSPECYEKYTENVAKRLEIK